MPDMTDMQPWRPSGMTEGRTKGAIVLHMNGSFLDIWIRVDGKPRWFAVQTDRLREFLDQMEELHPGIKRDPWATLSAESSGNAEPEGNAAPFVVTPNRSTWHFDEPRLVQTVAVTRTPDDMCVIGLYGPTMAIPLRLAIPALEGPKPAEHIEELEHQLEQIHDIVHPNREED